MNTTPPPANACDSHIHAFDYSFPCEKRLPEGGGVEDYLAVRSRLGLTRTVVVQTRPYGVDNSSLLAVIATLGRESTRGIAVVRPDVTERDLERLHEGGVRGVRFSLGKTLPLPVSFDMVEPVAHKVHALGWHLQLHWTADQFVEYEALLHRLPTPLVFDHMARLPVVLGISHPAFEIVQRLLLERRAWLKVSGAYLFSKEWSLSDRAAINSIAQSWICCAPDRLVWGSDWPHLSEKSSPPDTAALFDLLSEWTDDDAIRHRILVDNPAALYGFG